jgi:hypothetical protein
LPTSPSSRGRPSGATISGRVIGPTGAASNAQEISPAATNGVTVKVVGTNISSVADGGGQFMLSDVPPGTVRLEFSGQGAAATVTISWVNQGDRIDIVVMLNGSNASLRSQIVDTEGPVSGVSGLCPSITFTVGDRLVHTSASTSFREGSCASIQNGSRAEVRGPLSADGSIQATRVEPTDDDDDDEDEDDDDDRNEMELQGTVSGLNGTCPAITFRLGNTMVVTDNATRFDGRCSAVQNGRRVEVEGVLMSDGRVRATEVELDD